MPRVSAASTHAARPSVAWRAPDFIKPSSDATAEEKKTHDGDVYVVPTDTLAALAGGGLSHKVVAKALDEAGFLHLNPRGDRRMRVWDHIPGLGNVRAVVIRAAAVEEKAPEPQEEEPTEQA